MAWRVLAFLFCLLAADRAEAIGFQFSEVPGDGAAPTLPLAIWYPSEAPVGEVKLGRFPIAVAFEGAIAGNHLPLIVISHGQAGWYGAHRDTAQALAEAGFVVAALNHPGDTVGDTGQTTTPAVMLRRPRDLSRTIDFMLGAWSGRDRLDPQRVGAYGYSAGGFTVLVALGGVPDYARIYTHCQDHGDDPMCAIGREVRARVGGSTPLPIPPVPPGDPRLRAAVLAAPAMGFMFAPDGLRNVTAAVQIWRPAQDEILLHPFHAEMIGKALPIPPDMKVVEKAGHFVFMTPCTPAMAQAVPALCTDDPAFDRAAFHASFNGEMVAFFRRSLGGY